MSETRIRVATWLGSLAMALAVVGFSGPATAAKYDPKEAGNPLRIAAYVVHPVGVALDYLIMRPCFWIGSHDPFKTLFGVTD